MTTPATGFPYLDAVLDRPRSVLAFAHRGGAYHPEIEGLENTLVAFAHAVSLGYDYLETDVHVTRDGVLLAFHDDVLDRVTDGTGAIADLTLDEVRRALVGGREPVPTLAELFDDFPDARFNIDLKSDGAVEVLADFVTAREAWDRVLVGSFSTRRTARFRALTADRVPTCAGSVEILAFRFLPSGRLARWVTRPAFGASRSRTTADRSPSPPPGWYAGRTPPASTCTSGPSTTPRRCTTLLDRGVDGLFTDRTDMLESVLTERGQWRGPGKDAR